MTEKRLDRSDFSGVVVNKSGFIDYMAQVYGVSRSDAAAAYRMVVNSIQDIVAEGNSLRLVGFGLFYLQKHKGNPVQFHSQARKSDDYLVFKFSASTTLNKAIRKHIAELR